MLSDVASPGRGANRPGLSAAEEEAIELAAGWMRDDGLDVSRDAMGNLYGRVAGSDLELPEVWAGSHLDTVPNGGDFDGALGVLAALEAVSALRERRPDAGLCVVSFRDEEGWRFGPSFLGSRAVTGSFPARQLGAADASGVTIAAALAELGLSGPPVDVVLPGSYLEVHIEQGPILLEKGAPVGVVSAIAGMAGYTVTIEGAAGHAGTTPMPGRRDAFMAAAEFALLLRDGALEIDGAVATIGEARIHDQAYNVIPGRVSLVVDARAPTADSLEALVVVVERAAANTESSSGCRVVLDGAWKNPQPMSARASDAIRGAVIAAGEPLIEFASGAGHDAGILAAVGVDTGMLFVRSLNGGVSHNPDELSTEADIAVAITVLTDALARLSGAH